MTQTFQQFSKNIDRQANALDRLKPRIVKHLAGACEKMKDANFSAQGFVENGTAKKWVKRKAETRQNTGKKILFNTGTMKHSVKIEPMANMVRVGVDLSKVPYAKVHNDGGRIIHYVKPHTRKHFKTGKRFQVKAFSRKISMPKRQYLGFSPDVIKIAHKDIVSDIERILNN